MQRPVIAVVTHDTQIALQVRTVLDEYHLIESRTGNTALGQCLEVAPTLTIIDTQLPDMPWERLVNAMRAVRPALYQPMLLMGPSHTLNHAAFEKGMQDIIERPPHPMELRTRVATYLRMQALQNELEDVRNVLVSLAHALEARDHYTHLHSERTATYAVALAQAYGWSEEEYEDIRIAGLLHDVGKIGIPDMILSKVGKLSDDEFDAVKVHPVVSERICMSIAHFQHALPFIRNHHERIDGHGYPDRLQGETIPGPARIIAIADTYDALTSTRPYRMALRPSEAIKVLTMNAGTQWDRGMVDTFIKLVHQDAFLGLDASMRPRDAMRTHA